MSKLWPKNNMRVKKVLEKKNKLPPWDPCQNVSKGVPSSTKNSLRKHVLFCTKIVLIFVLKNLILVQKIQNCHIEKCVKIFKFQKS